MGYTDRPLICYPDVLGTDEAGHETDEPGSTAQFENGFGFEERRASLEEIRAQDLWGSLDERREDWK